MAVLPLAASFEGDVAVLLVPVDDQDTVEVVGRKVAAVSVGRRVADGAAPIRLRHGGQVLPPERRIGEVVTGPLDYVEAFFDEP